MIQALPEVRNFEPLPQSGKHAIKITSDGNLEPGDKGKTLPGKALDFKWNTGDTTFYAMHKYTKEGGGNQDSQYKEMIDLMKRFLQCSDEKIVLVVIVDGEYYQENEARKLKQLKRLERSQAPKSYACPIEDLPAILARHAGKNDA